ncbi:permeases of the major facilitator superfamily [Burkholderia pseudomallei 305]|nr:permeases of the major facilitator superfamily [Burkholderia pseudomallei 305]
MIFPHGPHADRRPVRHSVMRRTVESDSAIFNTARENRR